MRRQDWTLLAIASASGEGLSPVQIQKALFVFGKQIPQSQRGDEFYEFEPYNYGPFDVNVYRDAEELARQGLVNINRTAERRWAIYSVTPAGQQAARPLAASALPKPLAYLQHVVKWTQQLSFRDLVRAIYARFPEYRARSVFQG